MALTVLFEHIGTKIKQANPWISCFAVNCVQLPDKKDGSKGEIVNFIGEEKEYHGIDDSKGSSFYIKTDPKFIYNLTRALSSSLKEYEVNVNFRFVFFAINQDEDYNAINLESIFSNNLREMNFKDYNGIERKPKIKILKSNPDSIQVLFEELKKKYDFGAKAVVVSIDAQLTYLSTKDCEEECGISTSSNILTGIDFCDSENINLLSDEQKQCLADRLCDNMGEPVHITNSNNSYNNNIPCGDEFILPDTQYDVYVNGVFNQAVSVPTLGNEDIIIEP